MRLIQTISRKPEGQFSVPTDAVEQLHASMILSWYKRSRVGALITDGLHDELA